ncbi:hypothetical protein [Azospirillum argentinense]
MDRFQKHLADKQILADSEVTKDVVVNNSNIHVPHPLSHPLDWEWHDKYGVPRPHRLEQFRDGSSKNQIVGHPRLIHDLAPTIQQYLFGKSHSSHERMLNSLRAFWRFLYKEYGEDVNIHVNNLSDIANDVSSFYWAYLRNAVSQNAITDLYGSILWSHFWSLMERAGCDTITWHSWPIPRDTTVHKDVPPRAVKYLYDAAKHELSKGRTLHTDGQAILRRLETSGPIELTTEHLPGGGSPYGPEWNEPDNILLTVYRGFQARLNGRKNPVSDDRLRFAICKSITCAKSSDCNFWPSSWSTPSDFWPLFAPTSLEAMAALILVTAETGWIDTARAIDVSTDNWYREGRRQTITKKSGKIVEIAEVIISGPEFENLTDSRAEAEEAELQATRPKTRRQHQTRSLIQSNGGFRSYAVIKYMIERTAPMREIIRADLASLRAIPAPSASQLRLIAKLDELARCPWLFSRASNWGGIGGFGPSSANNQTRQSFEALKDRAATAAKRSGEEIQLITAIKSLTISDFRDAYAAWTYNRSGNNIFAVQAALNHRSINTTRRYLRQKTQIRERFAACARVVEAGFDEVQANRDVDPTILYLAADQTGLGVSDEDRSFLANFRSSCDAQCVDPTHPPEEIEPSSDRIEGELCGAQRCALCKNARFDRASLHGIAVRIAELRALCSSTPSERWLTSTYAFELEALELLVEDKFSKHSAQVWAWVREHRNRLEHGDALVFGTLSVHSASSLITNI